MPEEFIPPSLKIAENVSDEEYRKARNQFAILWTGTMAAPFIGLALWFFGIRLAGWMLQAIISGVACYALLNAILPEAKKISTMRMRKYKELRTYRAAKKRLHDTSSPSE